MKEIRFIDLAVDGVKDLAPYQAGKPIAELERELGITGTPSFLINGQPLVGGQPNEVFAQIIEDAAAAAGSATS